MQTDFTVSKIIELAGGPLAIEQASEGRVKAGAVYKWPKIGIPDRHWPLVLRLAKITSDQMLNANVQARGLEHASEAAE